MKVLKATGYIYVPAKHVYLFEGVKLSTPKNYHGYPTKSVWVPDNRIENTVDDKVLGKTLNIEYSDKGNVYRAWFE